MSGKTVWIVGALALAFSTAASAGTIVEAKRAISESNFITPAPVPTTPTDPTDDRSSDGAGDNVGDRDSDMASDRDSGRDSYAGQGQLPPRPWHPF